MLFNSSHFLIFFPVVLAVYFLIPKRIRYIWLLITSYYFYMSWNAKYALLLLFSTAVTYAAAQVMDHISRHCRDERKKVRNKKLCLGSSIIVNLAILFTFKYLDFAIDSLNYLLQAIHVEPVPHTFSLLLPVGISFYIFQALGYAIDVYREDIKPERNFFRYALFVSFFPQLVAGPIERSKNLMGQLNKIHKFSFEAMKEGLILMIWGYFLKMVVADRITIFVDAVYGNIPAYPGWYLIIASVLFAFQVYCDFAGYSVIAMGAAKIMGFQLMDNFNAPYFAKSAAEFWHRWHISLSTWFKDYLYIPLGGNRKGKVRHYINLMIVFLVSGAWHGASFTYIIWGGINGLYQVFGKLLKPFREKVNALLGLDRNTFSHRVFQVVFTFIMIDITWVFFRAQSLDEVGMIFSSIFHAENLWILFDGSLYELGLDQKNYQLMWLSIVILMIADYLKYRGIRVRDVLQRQELWFRWLVYITGVVGIVIFGIYGAGYDASSFIYFQF